MHASKKKTYAVTLFVGSVAEVGEACGDDASGSGGVELVRGERCGCCVGGEGFGDCGDAAVSGTPPVTAEAPLSLSSAGCWLLSAW